MNRAVNQRLETLEILGASVTVLRKRQKNMYLSVRPDGTLRVSCPLSTPDAEIKRFVSGHADWLRRVSSKTQRSAAAAAAEREGDALPFWGKFFVKRRVDARPYGAALRDGELIIFAPADATSEEIAALTDSLRRRLMSAAVPPLLTKWQSFLGVRAASWHCRDMKTRWGSCNTRTGRLCFNVRLTAKDSRCLEYVVVHELCHLIVPNHSALFWENVARCLPNWEALRQLTNEPVEKI